jgi:hypothetical protein
MKTRSPRLTFDELSLGAQINGRVLLLVEGNHDRDFYAWYLGNNAGKVHIYTAEDVEVAYELLHRFNLTEGARSRLIALARSHSYDAGIRILVDRDCGQDLFDDDPLMLLVTDYPALESYAFTSRTIDKWLKLILGDRTIDAEQLVDELRVPLFLLYLLRAAVFNLVLPAYDKCYRKNSLGAWSLDLDRLFVEAKIASEDASQVQASARVAQGEARQYIYGHDIAGLLDVRFRSSLRNRAQLRTVEGVERTLRLAIEKDDLDHEPLFVSLREWVEGSVADSAGTD